MADDIAEYFISRAEKVHPVSNFHKLWFADLAEKELKNWQGKQNDAKKKEKFKNKAKQKLLKTLNEEELEALDIKVK